MKIWQVATGGRVWKNSELRKLLQWWVSALGNCPFKLRGIGIFWEVQLTKLGEWLYMEWWKWELKIKQFSILGDLVDGVDIL